MTSPSSKPLQIVLTTDNKEFPSTESALVGSIKKVRDRDIHTPAVIGEYPVFVEQHGSYRMYTYSRKIKEIREGEEGEELT